MTTRPLHDKVAIITGAGGGIGAATAQVMAARGAIVVLADVHLDGARRAAEDVRQAGGRAEAVYVDLADEESIRELVGQTMQRHGRLDVLHNNAADQSPELGPRDRDVETMETAVWDRIMQVNLRGTMLCCHYALPHMVKQGSGSIINTGSNLGLQGQLIQCAYSASKAAILQLTRSIATSHGRRGIRCNMVSPGLVLSPAARQNLPPRLLEIVASETLTPQLGEPLDIAYAAAYLASDEARYVTGQNLVVDGGTSSHVPGFAQFSEMFATS
ncbi:SDR family NAD(P)-dependent oxidoreductase [Dyella sp. C9]|uniref:SDR family NAD(P)-dependent oxidoreductase n=1 Tax=Dyella sp. C9 TaxID=2202154 RepID=UPI000DEF4FAA|nr:SDR family NAD(P)-dependent oxidoreductase [Dyella sp. C9]